MITDGTFSCALCGEDRTGCNLCYTAPLIDNRPRFEREKQAQRTADIELFNQERSIRKSAEERRRNQ